MNLQDFNIIFKKFVVYYGEEKLGKEKQELYYLALKDLSKEEFLNGFIRMIRDREYTNFPSIAEIRKYGLWLKEEDVEVRIHIAKEKLKQAIKVFGAYQSVAFDDPNIHAVIDSLGGWVKVCMMKEEELEKFITFEFRKIYKVYLRSSYNINSRYTGLHDKENNNESLIVIGNKNQYLEWSKKNVNFPDLLGDNRKIKLID
ncbi:DUF6475 domain-containing protein [Sebaldella termitidis]|uniref:DUF6475 domain-containing protein n=1 Tax=Sebaldella termitidis TaxID=826 RepID=UPI003EB80488